MTTWTALRASFGRAEQRDHDTKLERIRDLADREQALKRHDPTLWASMQERKRLVAYWAFLAEIGGMKP